MYYNYLTILLISFLNISCNQLSRPINPDYVEAKSKFPGKFVDFFPDDTGRKYSYVTMNDTTNEFIAFVYYDFDVNDIKLRYDSLMSKANFVAHYNAMDSNLVSLRDHYVIDKDPTMEMFYDKILIKNKTYYHIIYFDSDDLLSVEAVDSLSPIGLSKDFTIYVLESKPGKYWKGLSPSEHMPKGWENGYTKGICINTKRDILIYWFVVW